MRGRVIATIMFVEFGVFALYSIIIEFVKTIILLFAYKALYTNEYFVAQDVLRVFFDIFFAVILVTVLVLLLLSASAWKSETFSEEYKNSYDWLIGNLVVLFLFSLFLLIMTMGLPRHAARDSPYRAFWNFVNKIGHGIALITLSALSWSNYWVTKKEHESYSVPDQ